MLLAKASPGEKEIMGKTSLPTVAVNRMVHGEGGAAERGPTRACKHRNASAGPDT